MSTRARSTSKTGAATAAASRAKTAAKKPAKAVPEAAVEPFIEVLNRQRLKIIDKAQAAKLSRAVLHQIGRPAASLTISFIRDSQMRRLNHTYRGLDKPTDVLSFAYHEAEDEVEFAEVAEHLGDLVISVETAERYAQELGLTFEREIEHLVIHGTLHLAGYDHETDNGEMKQLEKRLRKKLLN